MITHYGLSWSAADVNWKRTASSEITLEGRIKGQLGRQGAPTKEERQESAYCGQYIGLYMLYNGDELLYVGEAGLGRAQSSLYQRVKQHKSSFMAGRWDKFSWFGREKKEKKKSRFDINLSQMEAVVIAITNPKFNKQGGSFKATQVFQVPEKESSGDIYTRLARIENLLVRKAT